jgi:diguanylate cyclase (GGDEF)-like protein/PAS domain S-box-containing protein
MAPVWVGSKCGQRPLNNAQGTQFEDSGQFIAVQMRRREVGKYAITILLAGGACLIVTFGHLILKTEVVITHFFYIPIVWSCIVWRRKGIFVACFLSAYLIASHLLTGVDDKVNTDIYRALVMIGVSVAVAQMAERTAALDRQVKFAYTELKQMFDTTTNPICIIDNELNMIRVNNAYTNSFGITNEQTMGRKCYNIIKSPLCKTPGCPLLRTLRGEFRIEYEEEQTQTDGRCHHFITTVTPFYGPAGKLIGIVKNYKNITERKQHEQVLAYRATHDALTDLPNRLLFRDIFSQALTTANTEGHRSALMLMDLDRFKEVNDRLGHHIGDLLLKEVSSRLNKNLRETEVAARFGGDEFLIMIPKISSEEDAMSIAQRISLAMEQSFVVYRQSIEVGASIGVAIYPNDGMNIETLEKNADVAMYAAKKNGGKKVKRFSPEMKLSSDQCQDV